VPTDRLVLARLEIDSGDGAAETASKLGHVFFDGTWKDVGGDSLRTPAFLPLLVQDVFEILDRVCTSQEGEEFVSELVESHSVSKEMGCADEQIKVALWLLIVERGRGWMG
jgi:hypothetical protein